MNRFLPITAALALVVGCGEGQLGDGLEEQGDIADALLIRGAGDFADSKCNVVLRDVRRPAQNGGFEADCASGLCWYVWEGTLELSKSAVREAAWVGVLHKSPEGQWFETQADKVDGGGYGFTRYRFRIASNTVRTGMSTTALMRTRLELSALIKNSKGGRLFDHNRIPGALDNYVLDSGNTWSIPENAAVCPGDMSSTRAHLNFRAGWVTEQHGAIVAGGKLAIDYDLSRLPACRGTHNGFPAWDIRANVRFLPSGEVREGSVRAFEAPNGVPNGNSFSVPFEVVVPVGTTRAELWFRNFSGAGSSCEAWDSNLGNNYTFDVVPRAPAKVTWAGSWGNGFSRACEHIDGLSQPVVFDSYIRERACMFIDADVYAPGLTDRAERPELIAAQVEYQKDRTAKKTEWLQYVGRVGNNYRYRWFLSREDLSRNEWSKYSFSFKFSTDGATWFRIAQGDGPTGGSARTIVRDRSWCMPGWAGCP